MEEDGYYDNLKVLLEGRELPAWRARSCEVLIGGGEYTAAEAHLDTLVMQDTAMTKLAELLGHVSEIAQDSGYLASLQEDEVFREELEALADEEETPHEGWAKQLLLEVFGVRTPELMLYPDTAEEGLRKRIVTEAKAAQVIQTGWQFFPNPTSGAFTILLPDGLESFSFRILDVTGKTQAAGNCTGSCEQDLNSLANGLYFVSLYSDGVLRYTGKLILSRE